jgi:lysozyme
VKRSGLQAALDNANVRAFLRAIRLGEGTSDEDGYGRLVGGGQFTDFSKHPRKLVWIKRYRVNSSAAGAYQILWPTWKALCAQYDFPDFSPASQDEAAVALIAGRDALYDVIYGRLAAAIDKCRLEWASLPGSPYGQRTEKYADVEAEYLKAGGTLK